MVEVFKTDIRNQRTSSRIVRRLQTTFPDCLISFDAEDCDKILRVESTRCIAGEIIAILDHGGHFCAVLDD
ncbi:MAG: hypothetical protein INR69_01810 [Mucilaginibacter polytrichastri]|nr:hypothetical protein [Mucilaginibacter polytrichastri]